MLKLSDCELDVVMNAAAPIDVHRRADFLESVAFALVNHPGDVGVGLVHRICAEQQARFYNPPLEAQVGRRRTKTSKYA